MSLLLQMGGECPDFYENIDADYQEGGSNDSIASAQWIPEHVIIEGRLDVGDTDIFGLVPNETGRYVIEVEAYGEPRACQLLDQGGLLLAEDTRCLISTTLQAGTPYYIKIAGDSDGVVFYRMKALRGFGDSELAALYAPIFLEDTDSSKVEADWIVPFDYDGDFWVQTTGRAWTAWKIFRRRSIIM
jgi:hypothetical protein